MNTINKIAARANAEGWNALALKKALDDQIQIDLAAAIEEWENSHARNEPVVDEEIVNTLISERRANAYMYMGNEVSPRTFQAYLGYNSPSIEGDVEGAQAWVSTAPVGEKVHRFHNDGNGITEERFEKTPGGWVRTFYKCENDKPSDKHNPWLTAGIRERVAKKIGAPLSNTFNQAFDNAVENLWP